jgi:uncharacterized repeat protein (TIGR03847 family)
MSDRQHDLGRVELLDAEAIGQPGGRRFRLFARSPRGTASLWLEREQLEALSLAIDQMLAQISGGEILRMEAMASVPAPQGAPEDFPDDPGIEFHIGQMQIGYDEDRDLILMRAAPMELIEQDGELVVREDVEPQFSADISRAQASRLSQHIFAVLAGGRPRCPFCGQPMEERHVCAKQNGYHPASLN